ncbi:MAG: hypothetical protein JSS62_05955 [Verrucomicrobia bacterium]|nr:hypothetical protein [Verrucomicrobiota bacterium]
MLLLDLFVHTFGLYCLHHCSLPYRVSHLPYFSADFEQQTFELIKSKERAAVVSQLFDQVTNKEVEVKQEFQQLQPEFAPSTALLIPQKEPLSLDISTPFKISDHPFNLDSETPKFLSPDEETFLTWQSQSLITPSSQGTLEDLFMISELLPQPCPYDGLEMLAESDHFDISVEYTQRQFRPGYIFKITFTPKQEILFKRIAHNYFFLLDRSNSIPRARFALNKEIVSKALELLKPQDSFNILLFDDKVCRLSEKKLLWNEQNIKLAREFLTKQSHGGYFAATELYGSLGKIIPDNVSDHEVNTVILLSDGDTYLSLDKQRQTIGEWTTRNQGKVSLYAAASGGGNNLPLLELISTFNKGSLIYSYDHRLLAERVLQLLSSIRNPIGKQMVATAITADKQATILLQPKNQRLPDLYQNRPFVIYGSINRLTDFVLFLQGKYYDHHFDIKKNICFEQAKVGAPTLEKLWTQLVVQDLYERFFEDGNFKHLDAAKHLLIPMQLPLLFID